MYQKILCAVSIASLLLTVTGCSTPQFSGENIYRKLASGTLNDQLTAAIAVGDLATVQALVKQGADVNTPGNTSACDPYNPQDCNTFLILPLVLATGRGFPDIAKYLISQHADPLKVNGSQNDAITSAGHIIYDDNLIKKYGQERCAEISHEMMSAFVPAVGDELIAANDVNRLIMGREETVLGAAAQIGDVQTMHKLIAAKADVNNANDVTGRSGYGLSPLMLAAFNHQPEAIKVLLRAHADVSEMTWGPNYNTALGYAARNADAASMKLLLDAKANPNGPVAGQRVPLIDIVRSDNIFTADQISARVAAINLLVTYNANIDQTESDDGATPLIASIWAPNPEIVQALLNAKANPNLKNSSGQTAMAVALAYINDSRLGTTAAEIPMYQKIVDELKAAGATQ